MSGRFIAGGLIAAATIAMASSSLVPLVPARPAATTPPSAPRKRRRTEVAVIRYSNVYADPAIVAWNAAVEARKAAKRAAKGKA